ncbi:MAG: hypothetical protein EZS28_007296 [Streblomastix strix]|uniref:Uncharacterized protein n=1 Tax=Streblomastix strix TaxID=222440 RepID=A0A5J4WQJ7_9EUKA|nr:MAG: hypothetical protein EZS28_007296 [Streblomastix strix]
MAKQPRLEDIETVEDVINTNLTEKTTNIFVESTDKLGDNIALISVIPAETEKDELDSFINKFDQNHYTYFDNANGKELRQALELDSYLKGKLIQQLKKDITKENSDKQIEKGLNVLCGLALKQSNILEIISENFIEILITHSKSIDGNIKSYSLELLFMLTENGGSELEYEIRNKFDSF